MNNIGNVIALGIWEDLEVLCVPEDATSPRPEKPFITYKLTTPFAEGMGQEITNYEKVVSDSEFEHDLKNTMQRTATSTISINVHGDNSLALDVYDWFRHFGMYTLNQAGYVVESVLDFGNRDFLQVDTVEQRTGFDVILRWEHQAERIETTIETINVEEENE